MLDPVVVEYGRRLEAALREDAEGFRAEGGTRLSWLLYILGACEPLPPPQAMRNLDMISKVVWWGRLQEVGACS